MELFLESRHNNLKETVKIGGRPIEERLGQISEEKVESVQNGESFDYFREVSRQLAMET